MEKIRGLQSGGVDFEQRQIERRIDGDDARRIDLAARERDIDFAGGDDMIIGHDEAVGETMTPEPTFSISTMSPGARRAAWLSRSKTPTTQGAARRAALA